MVGKPCIREVHGFYLVSSLQWDYVDNRCFNASLRLTPPIGMTQKEFIYRLPSVYGPFGQRTPRNRGKEQTTMG